MKKEAGMLKSVELKVMDNGFTLQTSTYRNEYSTDEANTIHPTLAEALMPIIKTLVNDPDGVLDLQTHLSFMLGQYTGELLKKKQAELAKDNEEGGTKKRKPDTEEYDVSVF